MVFLCSETKILIYKKVLDLISSNTFKNNTSGFLLAVSRDTLQSICMTWLELLSLQPRLIFFPPDAGAISYRISKCLGHFTLLQVQYNFYVPPHGTLCTLYNNHSFFSSFPFLRTKKIFWFESKKK